MLILVNINGNRHRCGTGALYKIMIWINAIVVTQFVHFVHFDVQLTKMNKPVNKEKEIRLQVKVKLGSYKSRLLQWWNTLRMGPDNTPKNF